MRTPRVVVVVVVAFAHVLVVSGVSGCDPFGFWNTAPIDQPRRENIKLIVQSPAAELDGLIDFAHPDGSPCAADDDGCVHVGVTREVRIASLDDCKGLTLQDALDA